MESSKNIWHEYSIWATPLGRLYPVESRHPLEPLINQAKNKWWVWPNTVQLPGREDSLSEYTLSLYKSRALEQIYLLFFFFFFRHIHQNNIHKRSTSRMNLRTVSRNVQISVYLYLLPQRKRVRYIWLKQLPTNFTYIAFKTWYVKGN